MRTATRASAQDAALARAFDALASPIRVALLRELRTPKIVSDIRVVPPADAPSEEVAIARQSVRRHLDLLVSEGVVVEHETSGGIEYGLNNQRLFSMSEDLLGLARVRPEIAPASDTLPAPRAASTLAEAEARLVLVHGAPVGHVYPLGEPPSGGAWRIGRHRDLEIPLDFDPFVSGENATIELSREARYVLTDLVTSRNGTSLNLRALPRGARVALSHGDLLGVGRSLLLFQTGEAARTASRMLAAEG